MGQKPSLTPSVSSHDRWKLILSALKPLYALRRLRIPRTRLSSEGNLPRSVECLQLHLRIEQSLDERLDVERIYIPVGVHVAALDVALRKQAHVLRRVK